MVIPFSCSFDRESTKEIANRSQAFEVADKEKAGSNPQNAVVSGGILIVNVCEGRNRII